jgi:hypothetical protein
VCEGRRVEIIQRGAVGRCVGTIQRESVGRCVGTIQRESVGRCVGTIQRGSVGRCVGTIQRGSVGRCVGTIQRGSGGRFKSGAKRAAKFANNINKSSWENFATGKIDSPNMRPFQGIRRQTCLDSGRKWASKTLLFE